MSWKSTLQVRDLTDGQKIEAVCRVCGHVHYICKATIAGDEPERGQLYLDEVERETRCRRRGCGGRVRLALVRLDELSGFVGGLA